ncbi:cell wall-associated NlpC family hydrolase [Amycolatopsis lexingtonensis]|uniref:Cell wall-associated NlpC family hydrolase n=1 Tax=Amycolatopsis lexingtonensis TaxID=218822 RepID=A0ABR9I469_9PSEU|nr:cell wall-associated NlpC family hydrolase [Amycolatopsis lexingtonensis]
MSDEPEVVPEETPEPRRRKAAVVVAAVVVVAAALVVGVQFAPKQQETTNAAATATPTPSVAKTTTPPQTSAPPKVPEASEFDAWASKTSQWLDIPLRAMVGYAKATTKLGKDVPGCHLSWVTLAAVGKVTTDHGRAQGGQFGTTGVLDKALGTIEVRDFYNKVVSTANAAGPMQLSPAIWGKYQASYAGGKPDVQNIDDAALTTGRALCADGHDLSQGQVWWDSVSTLQAAPLFLHRTLATVNVYGTVGQGAAAPNAAVLSAVNFAIDKIGLPYIWGGNGTGGNDPGFDCSGLTTAAYASAGVKLMRTADTQFRSVPHVTDPQLGDLIFYGEPATKIHHVGLYIGNQQMIDAPQTGQAVQVHSYRKEGDDYAGAGRPTA